MVTKAQGHFCPVDCVALPAGRAEIDGHSMAAHPVPQFFLSLEAYFSPLGYTAFGFVVPPNDELFLGTPSSLPSVSHLTSGWARGAFFLVFLTRPPPSEEAGVSELRKAANFRFLLIFAPQVAGDASPAVWPFRISPFETESPLSALTTVLTSGRGRLAGQSEDLLDDLDIYVRGVLSTLPLLHDAVACDASVRLARFVVGDRVFLAESPRTPTLLVFWSCRSSTSGYEPDSRVCCQ
ncbi:hypothetical protein HPB50_015008 [Hyalomma asiaticum]|uniref:Uncharacterized protein n=1 Tax=Hyalomma asiaticum TaxID=266040 RepID=A0ACB7RNL0_HYAAI|nr:hypothetical protein HPB50_015008 [Hyalomma asiaticum]